MDVWTYPTLYSELRDKLPPELRDLAAFHSNAMADMAARGDPMGPKQIDAEHKWLQDSRPGRGGNRTRRYPQDRTTRSETTTTNVSVAVAVIQTPSSPTGPIRARQ